MKNTVITANVTSTFNWRQCPLLAEIYKPVVNVPMYAGMNSNCRLQNRLTKKTL
jgi:hypothetical protein